MVATPAQPSWNTVHWSQIGDFDFSKDQPLAAHSSVASIVVPEVKRHIIRSRVQNRQIASRCTDIFSPRSPDLAVGEVRQTPIIDGRSTPG